jgi:hypothetical protein
MSKYRALDMGNFDVEYPIINVPSAGTGLTQHRKALLFLDHGISKARAFDLS